MEEQEKATKRAENRAIEAQQEQEAVALEEQTASDKKLEEARARIVKGRQGRGGLLFGSELGTENLKTTLGA